MQGRQLASAAGRPRRSCSQWPFSRLISKGLAQLVSSSCPSGTTSLARPRSSLAPRFTGRVAQQPQSGLDPGTLPLPAGPGQASAARSRASSTCRQAGAQRFADHRAQGSLAHRQGAPHLVHQPIGSLPGRQPDQGVSLRRKAAPAQAAEREVMGPAASTFKAEGVCLSLMVGAWASNIAKAVGKWAERGRPVMTTLWSHRNRWA